MDCEGQLRNNPPSFLSLADNSLLIQSGKSFALVTPCEVSSVYHNSALNEGSHLDSLSVTFSSFYSIHIIIASDTPPHTRTHTLFFFPEREERQSPSVSPSGLEHM